MALLYTVTLTPIESVDQAGNLESILIVAQRDSVPDKCWNLTPCEFARVFADFFSPRDISVIEEHLHSGKSVSLPNSYSATELTEMGYRLKTEK